MDVTLSSASDLVDRFEELLLKHGISVPQHPQTKADMLPFSRLLAQVRGGFFGSPDALRKDYTAAVAVHDLAAKVLEVEKSPEFGSIVPHLALLASGAIHLTEEPPAYADVYNKLIEAYWACLCLSADVKCSLDDPKAADGKNPDVITIDEQGNPRHAYAFKTIRSAHTQNLLDHITKGIDQIEKSPSPNGVVALHLTPRLQDAQLWPMGAYFSNWGYPAVHVSALILSIVSQVLRDNGQDAIDALFRGKKAFGSILCVAFCPTVAIHPVTQRPTVMPLKVPQLVQITSENPISSSLLNEVAKLNDKMQKVLG